MDQLLTGPLISAERLAAIIGDHRLRLADVRWSLGDPAGARADYVAGHIPGAVFVDLDHDLSAAVGPGRHPLPDPTAFADRLGQLGFGDDHGIVVYDALGGLVAARMWWMLDRLGHHQVAMLDGGLAAWIAAGGGLTPFLPSPLRTALTLATHWPDTVDRAALLEQPDAWDVVDVRAPERYRGETEPVDRVPGHIPGARNRPVAELLDPDGRLLPPDRLADLLAVPAERAGKRTVFTCGSGVNACMGIFAARVAGTPEPLLYPGSYSDWSAARLPVNTGEQP